MKRHRLGSVFAVAATALLAGRPFAHAGTPATTADVSVVKTRTTPNPVHPGEVIGFDFTVTNNGLDDAANVVLTDVLPANTTFDEGGGPNGWNCTSPAAGDPGTFQCTIATLPAGTTATGFFLEIRIPNANVTPITNTATVSSATFDPDSSNNSSSVSTDVAALPPPATDVPTLSGPILAALAAALSLAGLLLLRR